MFGRTSSSAAFCISGWRNLNTISGSPAGEAVFVSDAPAQDEGMVVESEVGGVEEEDFPDPGLENRTLRDKIDTELLCGSRDKITVFEENLCRREPIRLQNKLAFEILDLVERVAVAVLTLLEIGNPGGPRFAHYHYYSS